MKFFTLIFNNFLIVLRRFLKLPIAAKVLVIIIIFGLSWFVFSSFSKSTQKSQYQTEIAEKGTLITSVSASGAITTANNVQITIQASGVVNEVLVKNGDTVTQGQTIAILTLDQASQQKAAAAWSSYLSAQNTLNAASAKINSLQSALFKANQVFMTDRGVINPSDSQKADPKYIEENAEWLQAEADYKNQTGVIIQAQAALNSASLTLSQTSSTITAPVAGVVKGLTITKGAIVTLSSQSNSSISTSQVLGSIYQEGPIQAQVNISEIDSVKVSEGQKVTMTLDAFPGKTFTGKVVTINTNGVVSSGVTTYPAVISFDTGNDHIYPNMAVSAKIIAKISDNVILVPLAAVQTTGEESTVRIIKNGQMTTANVEIGDSSDTQTEILSGVNEGDTVVTSVSTPVSTSTSGSTSPFGSLGDRGGFGGGNIRVGGR